MRTFVTSMAGAAVLSLFGAVSAQACIPAPPTYWPGVRFEGGPAMIIGRVNSVTRATEPVRTEYFEIWNEIAVIVPVETVQGTARTDYAVTAVGDYSELEPGPMFCADRMVLKPGDLVLGYERENGRLEIVRPIDFPDDLRARLEAHR